MVTLYLGSGGFGGLVLGVGGGFGLLVFGAHDLGDRAGGFSGCGCGCDGFGRGSRLGLGDGLSGLGVLGHFLLFGGGLGGLLGILLPGVGRRERSLDVFHFLHGLGAGRGVLALLALVGLAVFLGGLLAGGGGS